ncbi:DUF6379 domain-containing protein [Niallia sp. MER 6]|uniref:C-glycoside deglycosidase beta subunit domain-containing protein n=1 Tax=Niallia sp. MER 6 TaxID=2939567 RepID=UPI00203F825C|nr:DUF6379 domain-containing protein [Niallia sp. MER 6]MCM3030716.1 DUF6379 domain-containing protein [Niallia sp. MER 6]
MTFIMKLPFVDTVVDNSLINTTINGKKIGYEFQIRLSYYRGHYLSCIEELSIAVNDKIIDSNDINFCLNGKEFTIGQLPNLVSEFWNVDKPATIKVYSPGGIKEGDYKIDVTLLLRNAYMYVPGNTENHNYAVLDSCGSKTLTLNTREGRTKLDV